MFIGEEFCSSTLHSGLFHIPREDGTPAAARRPSFPWTSTASLGWSLVLPGGFGNEMGPDVTRFFKRLCSETWRLYVQKFEILRKGRPQEPPLKKEAKSIIGCDPSIVLSLG
jgi:hypothetical protein